MRQRLQRLSFTDILVYLIGFGILLLVVVGSFLTIQQGRYGPRAWIDLVLFGITTGSIYSLIALGYTLVYGILRMINFAHSEVFMVGPMTAYFLAEALARAGLFDTNPGIALFMVFVFSMAIATIVAILLERIAYRPLRFAPRLVPLITAIGASFFLQYAVRGLFGANIKVYPEIPALEGAFVFGIVRITYIQILVVSFAAAMMVGLQYIVQRTRMGRAMRAVSENKETAAMLGVNVNNTILVTFLLGGALAGAAGVLYALLFTQVSFAMGFVPGIKAFTAAVLGGIGNVPGAMIGGLFLGLVESVGPTLFLDGLGVPAPYQLKDAIAFALLVLVLIFRPAGILGEALAEKKA